MIPKPEPRKRIKARAKRAEGKVKGSVRAQCVERDGYCRFVQVQTVLGKCDGPSEWAHALQRFRTRGMAPEARHQTATSMILCQAHHFALDKGTGADRLKVNPLTDDGLDGPVYAIRNGQAWEESEKPWVR